MSKHGVLGSTPTAITSIVGLVLLTACSGASPQEERAENIKRGDALVGAIQQYMEQIGSPPTTLAILVPDYLAEIPKTYSGSEFEYFVTDNDATEPWILFFDMATDGSGCGYRPRFEMWDCSPPGAGDV